MENHHDLTDLEFEQQFADSSLDPKLFSHEAHLRLAWIHLSNYGIDNAINNIRRQLQQYVNALGAKSKYNETVTVAAIRAVDHFMRKSAAKNFKGFIAENPRLKFQFKELMSFHYRTDIFISQRAKKEYVAPELLPFD